VPILYLQRHIELDLFTPEVDPGLQRQNLPESLTDLRIPLVKIRHCASLSLDLDLYCSHITFALHGQSIHSYRYLYSLDRPIPYSFDIIPCGRIHPLNFFLCATILSSSATIEYQGIDRFVIHTRDLHDKIGELLSLEA